jgi:hypothetical protein
MKIAVICIFLNEYFFIPYWQKYYGSLFGYENLYAIGDLQNDSSMKLFEREVNKINYAPQIQANFGEHVNIILNLQKQLLSHYDVVIFAEADQFFVPDPDLYTDLKDYLEKNTQDYIKVSGWNVLHIPEVEPKFNPSMAILSQRGFWFKDPEREDKLVIVRKPMESYSWGFHNNVPDVERDVNLYNIHLHSCNFALANSRSNTKTNKINWWPGTGQIVAGGHTWIQDEELVDVWLKEGYLAGIQFIPHKFRGIL